MNDAEELAILKRDMRRMKRALLGFGAVALAGALVAATAPAQDAKFRTITAERINIAEPDGIYRVVLTNEARTPGPMLEAREGAKEGTRNFPFGGIILYNRQGLEQGGYGTGAKDGLGSMGVSILDWPLDDGSGLGEAIGSFRRVEADGKASAGFFVVDRPPAGSDPTDGIDRRRIKLQNVDRDAELLLADAAGKDRIKLRVDKSGDAYIEILDVNGQTVFRAPEQ